MQMEGLVGHRSEADLRHLLEKLPAGAYTCDSDGLITYFNQHAVDLWGRSPNVNHPADRFCGSFRLFATDGTPIRHDRCWMARALQENREFNGQEIVIERGDGTRATVLAHANPLRDRQGNLIGAVNILVDITERKSAEAARAHLAAIVESSQDAIIGKTLDGVITSWNRGAERLYGYTAKEAVGRPISLLVPPDCPDELSSIMARIRRGLRVEPYETVRVAKDGRRIDVWLTVSPVRAAGGQLIGASAVARDITERKWIEHSQQLLAAVGATLSSSLDHEITLQQIAHLAVPLLGDRCVLALRRHDGTIDPVAAADVESGNKVRIPTFPAESDAACGVAHVIHTGQSALYSTHDADQVEQSPAVSDYARQLRHIGAVSAMIVPLSARGQTFGAITYATGNPSRRYTARDLDLAEEVGRRCALAIDNAQLYAEAHTALRLRNEVLASVTHDLKNPLAGISALAEVLELKLQREGNPSSDQIAVNMRRIHERARSMAKQLDELLDVAALEMGGTLDLRQQPTDLVTLVRQVAADAQCTTDRHKIHVSAQPAGIIGQWDQLRLDRVVRNLLSNAVNYSPNGGCITINVFCLEDRSERWAVLSVRDEGIGIPANDLSKIFDRFARGANVAGQTGGTGLGMAGVRQIVQQHGGTLDIHSQEGDGTTVAVKLPLVTSPVTTSANQAVAAA